MPRLIVLTISVATLSGACLAQTSSVTVPQVGEPEKPSAATQTSNVSTLPAQSSDSTRKTRSELTASPEQIGVRARPAASAANISSSKDGRALDAAAIGGQDRCDVASTGRSSPAACKNRLETRTSEFTKPAATPVTAEAELLVLSQSDQNLTVDEAARRGGSGDAQLQALVGQAASVLTNAVAAPKSAAAPTVTSTNPGVVVGVPH